MIKPYDGSVMLEQISHIEQAMGARFEKDYGRSVKDYFDEYWVQYEGEGLASGDGPGELYKRLCSDQLITPMEELV